MTALSEFEWFAERLLRGSGWGLALQLEAHFDESGTHAGELTVAGYLFEADRISQFAAEWDDVLKAYHLPYFHMSECAHGIENFQHLNKTECVAVQMKLMSIVKRFSINGIVANIKNIPSNSGARYSEAVILALNLVVDWSDRFNYSEKIAYFFEAGAKGQGIAESNFGEIANSPERRSHYRYAGHSFIPKDRNPGVQAADLLAWQYHNFTKKRLLNNVARRDLRALLRHPHLISDECGKPPRISKSQSIKDSQSIVELIHYLKKIDENKLGGRTVLVAQADFGLWQNDEEPIRTVLACPSCLRVVSETLNIHNIVIRCFCGEYLDVPNMIPPNRHKFRLSLLGGSILKKIV